MRYDGKGLRSPKEVADSPREALSSKNIFAVGGSCIALSERYYITAFFSDGSDI